MSDLAKKGGSPSREMLYSEAASLAPKALKVVEELLSHKNENVRLGAAKTVLAKTIPDLKSSEDTIAASVTILLDNILKKEE